MSVRGGGGFPVCITGHMIGGRSASRGRGEGSASGGGMGRRKAGGTHPTGMLSCKTFGRNGKLQQFLIGFENMFRK